MINRLALKNLRELLSQFPAVGIIGPRQVGKTTLAKLVSDADAVYLDLESDLDSAKLTNPGLFLRVNKDRLVILDEVQQMPEIFTLLRSLIDEDRRPGRFILLGSATPALIRKSADSLAGRIAYLELTSLLQEETAPPLDSLWLKGGFPKSYLENETAKSLTWRLELINTYVQRDLPQLGLNAAPRVLNNLLRMLAHSNAQLWNASQFAKSLGLTSPTIKSYLHFLEGAMLIDIIEPYYTNIKKRITKSPKTYYKDTGILHALLRIETLADLQGHPAIGSSWENFVIQQVKGHLGNRFEYHFYRTHDGTEMDLVLCRGGAPVMCAEIKYSLSPTLTKGMKLAMEDLGTEKNFVIIPTDERFPIHEKMEVIGLRGFIEEAKKA